MSLTDDEGWTWAPAEADWHYFRGNMSLCFRFILSGDPVGGLHQGHDNSPIHCSLCRRALNDATSKEQEDST